MQSIMKFVQLYWLQVIEYPYSEILTNIAAHKIQGSVVCALLNGCPLLHVASGVPGNRFYLSFKLVFHFKRTAQKRIKNIFKFQNSVNVDWLILSQYAKKLTCDELFMLIREYIRKYVDLALFNIRITHAHQHVSVRYG